VPVPVAAHLERCQPHVRWRAAAVPAAVLTKPYRGVKMIATTTRAGAWRKIVLMLAACLLLAACGRVTLFADLDERQANEVLAVLLTHGISADKRSSLASDTGYQVRVSQGDFPRAMQM